MTADNAIGGIDIQHTPEALGASIEGALVVGRSYGNPGNYVIFI